MGVKEAVRLAVVREAHERRISIREGMRRTGLSRSQFLRYKRRYQASGPAGLIHASRGRPSSRRLGANVRAAAVRLLEQEVPLNDCHVHDLLQAEGWSISIDSVRRIRRERGMPPKQRRRPRQYRRRREREAQEGAMVLIDGSPFRWLGPEQGESTLIGSMDDATGKILALTFRPHEDLHGFTVMLRDTVQRWGVPWTLYGDRAGVLVRNDRHWTLEEELQGRQHPSHFGRMLESLGIRYIAALSPQAKGRIERLWRTLQDRLAAELALKRITSLADAEAFLPGFVNRHNRRFAHVARDGQPAWRRPPRDLDRLLGCRYPRVVRLDNTVLLANESLQLPPGPSGRSYAHSHVEVRELLDGRRLVMHQDRTLLELPAPPGTFQLEARASARARFKPTRAPVVPVRKPPKLKTGSPAYLKAIKPRPDHPFRGSYKTLRQR